MLKLTIFGVDEGRKLVVICLRLREQIFAPILILGFFFEACDIFRPPKDSLRACFLPPLTRSPPEGMT